MSNVTSIFNKKKSSLALISAVDADKSQLDNEVGYVYDKLTELRWGRLTATIEGFTLQREIVTLPSTIKLPFAQAVRLFITQAQPNTTYLGIMTVCKWTPRKCASFWTQILATSQYDIAQGFEVSTYRNNSPTNVQRHTVTISKNHWAAAKAAIDSTGVYERVETGFIVRSRGYYIDGTNYYIHIEYEPTADLTQADYMEISWNARNAYIVTSETAVSMLIWGFQVHDTQSKIKYNIDLPLYSLPTQVGNSNVKDSVYRATYLKENYLANILRGGGQTTIDGVRTNNHYGAITYQANTTRTLIDDTKFFTKFTIAATSGNLLKYVGGATVNQLYRFFLPTGLTTTEKNNCTFNFWVKRSEMGGNGIVVTNMSNFAFILRYGDMFCKGFRKCANATGVGTTAIEVMEVDGDYTAIRIYFEDVQVTDYSLGLSIYNETTTELTAVNLYNFNVISSKVVDPYFNYTSQAQKNNSAYIGKNVLLIGDSQYNGNEVSIKLIKELGVNIIDEHWGGHAMAIRSGSLGSAHYQSFYHRDLRDKVIDYTNIDIYFFTASTNDGAGGGEITQAAVQFVLDNYPAYGDDAGTVAAKQALFDAGRADTTINTETGKTLGAEWVDDNFTFQACYSAYLKQLQTARPTANIILATVPISCSGLLTGATVDGHGVWVSGQTPDTARLALQEPVYEKIRGEIIEVANKHNVPVVDFYTKSRITFETFIYDSIDGTHWTSLKKKENMALATVDEIKQISL
jgi:hypothetical protein